MNTESGRFKKTGRKMKWVRICVAAIVAMSVCSNVIAQQVYLDQGWDEQGTQRELFYNLTQGSQLLPYDFFLAVEDVNSMKLLRSDRSLKRWGYLPADKYYDKTLNPDRLPIGFVKDIDAVDGSEHVGFTCAACHTGQINYRGKEIRIEGGQSLSDFVGFVNNLKLSFEATKNKRSKFSRFVKRLNIERTQENMDELVIELDEVIASLDRILSATETVGNSGIGRLDAFGSIGNTILEHDLGKPNNFSAPKAPVSIPFLWQTSQLERTQYTGIAENNFARNIGEVLGVFGRVDLQNPETLFDNSIKGENISRLEGMVRELTAPQWPEEILGDIDQEAAERGYHVYTKTENTGYSCASCHALPNTEGEYPLTPAEDNLFGQKFIQTMNIPLADIGTDPNAANLIFQPFPAETGTLSVFFNDSDVAPSFVIEQFVFGALTQRLFEDLGLSEYERAAYSGFRIYADGKEPAPNVAAYRARPLPGIWATSPYLHNGSVRNMTELLKPADDRETEFYVGSRYFDPVNVGFVSAPNRENYGGKGKQKLDTAIDGNSAAGHEYGVYFSDDEKLDLIEFMKTL